MAKIGVQLKLDADVWRRSRAVALLNGLTMSSVVEKFLREWSGFDQEGSLDGDTAAQHERGSLGEGEAQGVRPWDLGEPAG